MSSLFIAFLLLILVTEFAADMGFLQMESHLSFFESVAIFSFAVIVGLLADIKSKLE